MNQKPVRDELKHRSEPSRRLAWGLVAALVVWALIMATGVLLKQGDWTKATLVAAPILIMAGLVAWGACVRQKP